MSQEASLPSCRPRPGEKGVGEAKLQRLRFRLKREPAQDEVLAEWKVLAAKTT